MKSLIQFLHLIDDTAINRFYLEAILLYKILPMHSDKGCNYNRHRKKHERYFQLCILSTIFIIISFFVNDIIDACLNLFENEFHQNCSHYLIVTTCDRKKCISLKFIDITRMNCSEYSLEVTFFEPALGALLPVVPNTEIRSHAYVYVCHTYNLINSMHHLILFPIADQYLNTINL